MVGNIVYCDAKQVGELIENVPRQGQGFHRIIISLFNDRTGVNDCTINNIINIKIDWEHK